MPRLPPSRRDFGAPDGGEDRIALQGGRRDRSAIKIMQLLPSGGRAAHYVRLQPTADMRARIDLGESLLLGELRLTGAELFSELDTSIYPLL
jgi:hypothetical protein